MIRPAGPADADAIAALHAVLFDEAWSARDIRALLDADGSVAFLARTETATIGFLIARVVVDEAEILTIGVDAGCRRTGTGGRLIDALEADVRQAGTRRIFLEVAINNDAALALYRRSGFAMIGRRADYYQRAGQPPIDAACMALELITGVPKQPAARP